MTFSDFFSGLYLGQPSPDGNEAGVPSGLAGGDAEQIVNEVRKPDAESFQAVNPFRSTILLGGIKLGAAAMTRVVDGLLVDEKADPGVESKCEAILSALSYANLTNLGEDQISVYLDFLNNAVANGEITQDDVLASIVPDVASALGMFYSDEFLQKGINKSIRRIVQEGIDPDSYRMAAQAAPVAKANYAKFRFMIAEYLRIFGEDLDMHRTSYVFENTQVSRLPEAEALKAPGVHKDAIDLFFNVEEGEEGLQEGPEIKSFAPGVVVASSNDWEGYREDRDESVYEGGGLTPLSGNAVVVFNPVLNEFYYYSHLETAAVDVGDFVNAGDLIGVGGNTGAGAIKPRRGRHLHFEIHKVDERTGENKPLGNLALLARLKKTL